MLDQENQVSVDQTTAASQANNKQQNNIPNSDTSSNNNNNNDNNHSINNPIANNNPSLFEHDYCSPNKGLSPNMQQSSETQIDCDKDQQIKAAPNCVASTSLPPDSRNNGSASVIVFGQASGLPETNPMPANFNDDDLSDSSLSLSSSDASSSKDLIIAQDSQVSSIKSLAPKDTPSVSRPKLGRRPMLKKEMAINSSKEGAQKHNARVRRPRQNTSVTDKSQWITGDDQIDSALSEHLDTSGREKRKRKELHDPEFSHFTSSEYSSSEAESDEDSGGESEDDPERPWCNCNKPHNDEFMIECDICKYWFHGRCVGVTEAMSSKYEAQGKEWFCPDCHNQLLSGTERNAIPLRYVKKEKKKKTTSSKPNRTGKRGRGRPRKSEPAREMTTRMSTRNARKSTSAIEKFGVKKKTDVRSESFEEFENNEKLKMLIKERKKQFFYKRSLAEQQKRAKMQELGLSRQSVTTPSLGISLDSLATSTSTPNMNNLPINIKSDHKERSKPNIVLQINTKKDGSSDQDSQRIVTTIVKTKKRKYSETKDTVVNDVPKAEPAKLNKKPKVHINITPPVAPVNQAGDTTPSNEEKKSASKNDKDQESNENTSTSIAESLPFLDTTKDHKNHVFNMNCKICTGTKKEQEELITATPASKEDKDNAAESKPSANEATQNNDSSTQPKRLRVSMDTKIEPVHLSRLKEPLIKPTISAEVASVERSPSKVSPVTESDSNVKEDEEELYDPELVVPNKIKSNSSTPPPTASHSTNDPCWSGLMNVPDVGKFSVLARPVSGDVGFMKDELDQILYVCGRIAPEQVTLYIKKLKSTTKNQVLLIQLHPQADEDKPTFDVFFDYLYSRNRCAVINITSPQILKDFYILPIHERSNIPEVLKPINGPGLDRQVNPNCLLGLLVKSKRPASASSSSSSYTPTPINK